MKATSDKLTSTLKGSYVIREELMTSFSGAAFWSSFLSEIFSGEQTSLHSLSLKHFLLVLHRCCSLPERRFLYHCI